MAITAPPKKGGKEESSVKDLAMEGQGISVLLENGKWIFLDFHQTADKEIMTGDTAILDYFPNPPNPAMATVNFTVKRGEKEIFRSNIPATRIISPVGATTV